MARSTHQFSPVRMVLRDYLQQTLRHKRLSIPSLLLPGLGNMLSYYVPPLVIAAVIRDFGGQVPRSLTDLVPYLLVFGGAWALGELCWHISYMLMSRYQSKVIKSLGTYALGELLTRDAAFFNDNFTGSLTKRVSAYSESYERFLDVLSFNISGNVLPLLFAVVVLWLISPLLVVVLIGLLVLTFFLVQPMIGRRMKLVRIREAASTKATGHVADVISNIATVQAFAHEDLERKRNAHNMQNLVDAMYNAWDYHTTRIHRTVWPINVLTNIVGLIIAVIVAKDSATMAIVFISFNYYLNATRLMFEFNNVYRNVEKIVSSAAEFTELLRDAPKIVNAPNAKDIHVTKGAISFKGVRFAYPENTTTPLFEDLSFNIPAGQRVALVGHSGGGKTSITRLLLRFADINSGKITIDDQPIADATLTSLRKSIAYVPQDPAMFHRSISENIRYGNIHATDEQIRSAAEKAHALEFIESLPQGFETLVGERGVKLSGGQRQRIAIARAILKDAPILLLDEATSALDSESEKLIQDALGKLMKQRTSIVIAHRLSTVAKLDRIIVLEKGTIIEDGTHTELTKQNGTYASLWAHQSGGFLEE